MKKTIIFLITMLIPSLAEACLIHKLVIDNDIEGVRQLLEADRSLANKEHTRTCPEYWEGFNTHATPIFEIKSVEMGELLLNYGADIHFKESLLGDSPLHHAATPEIAQFFIDNGIDIDVESNNGMTPLIRACRYKSKNAVAHFLIDTGADVNKAQRGGDAVTALSMSVLKNNLDLTKKLIKKGARIEKNKTYGETLAHVAIEGMHFDMLQYVINELGVNPHEKNNNGDDAFDYAQQLLVRQINYSHPEININKTKKSISYLQEIKNNPPDKTKNNSSLDYKKFIPFILIGLAGLSIFTIYKIIKKLTDKTDRIKKAIEKIKAEQLLLNNDLITKEEFNNRQKTILAPFSEKERRQILEQIQNSELLF